MKINLLQILIILATAMVFYTAVQNTVCCIKKETCSAWLISDMQEGDTDAEKEKTEKIKDYYSFEPCNYSKFCEINTCTNATIKNSLVAENFYNSSYIKNIFNPPDFVVRYTA